ncbi:MAG: SURF1 family protein [Gammaproteobacteria bacterium]|jgi:surfeit locus 1 family protein
MRLGNFEFRPGLWPTLITLLLLPMLVGLGLWQLERATWKQGLVDAHEASTQLAPVELDWLLESGELAAFRPVRLRGRYDLAHQLLLDNRTYRGHAGYHVLSPLQLADGGSVVLVNRGWVPTGLDRAVLPELPGPAGPVVIEAVTSLPPEKLFRLGDAEERNEDWPKVVQQLNMARLEQLLGARLLPVILLLDKSNEYGFLRDWQPVYGVTPDKHRAYAMQWFTLALVLLLIYIGVNSKRVSDKPIQEDHADK